MCINDEVLEEIVFAIPTHILWNILPYRVQGFIAGNKDILNSILGNGVFRKRSALEEDPAFKQIIPYAIVSHQESYYLFTRRSGQREKRLHNKLHLGMGGHMNPGRSEQLNEEYVIQELKREFFEEVRLLKGCTLDEIIFIGFINDDTIPVGRVHLGLLFDIHVSNRSLAINETDKMSAQWIGKGDLVDYYDEMETWTKIAVDAYLR